MRPLTRHERAGCRRWSVRELGILRDPAVVRDVIAALDDPEPLVRSEAAMSLGMCLHVLEGMPRAAIREALARVAEADSSADVRNAAREALRRRDRS